MHSHRIDRIFQAFCSIILGVWPSPLWCKMMLEIRISHLHFKEQNGGMRNGKDQGDNGKSPCI